MIVSAPPLDKIEAGPVVLFDGYCHLCDGTVDWILRHDRARVFRFAPLQSPTGRRLLKRHGLPLDRFDTVVLVEGARAWTRSAAAVEVLRRIPRWRALGSALHLLPRPLRDAGYALVARLRYRIWGRRSSCTLPAPEHADRFL
jgi:predicted DCC family thiol-disulfide oxidoreductase YuxK